MLKDQRNAKRTIMNIITKSTDYSYPVLFVIIWPYIFCCKIAISINVPR